MPTAHRCARAIDRSPVVNGIAELLRDLFQSVGRLGGTLAAGIDARVRRFRDALREEMRRLAAALAFALLAAACGFAALLFGAGAVMIAAWNTHAVLAAALIAMTFALIAVLAVLLVRGNTR